MEHHENSHALGDVRDNPDILSDRRKIEDFFLEPSEFVRLLEPLTKALHWPGHYRHLIEALPHFHRTLDLTEFRNVLARIRYKSEPIEVPLIDLDERVFPCIYLNPDRPAMLVLSREASLFKVIDGETGEEETVVGEGVTGIAYVFTEMEQEVPRMFSKKTWLTENLERFRKLFLQIMFISLVMNIFVLAVPMYIMNVYDKVIPTGSYSMLFFFSLGVMIALVTGDYLMALRTRIIAYIGVRLDRTVGEVIIERLLYLPAAFTENAGVGAQIARIKDFDNVRDFFTSPLMGIVFEFPFVFFFLAIIWMLSGILILVPLVMIVLFAVIYWCTAGLVRDAIRKSAAVSAKKQTFQIESLSHLRDIKVMGCEGIWNKRYDDLTAEMSVTGFESTMLGNILNNTADILMMLTGLAVLGFGAYLVTEGTMTVGALIATMMLTWRALAPLKTIFSIVPRIEQLMSSLRQINNLMGLRLEREPHVMVNPVTIVNGKVEFSRVSFRYRPDVPPALLGVSFSVKPGELVCLAGRNGSGKSTILKLIPGVYQPQAGNVLLDDFNIQQLDPIELRHAIAYLPQNTQLFYGTLEQNLLLSNPLATPAELIEATQLAGIYDEIMAFPFGFQTRMQDNSIKYLSSSFIQRFALARTYVRKAKVILLDEPASYLGPEHDAQFLKALETLRGKSTIIMVSHRPAHLKIADRIFYVEQGQVLMGGTPQLVLSKLPIEAL